MAQMQLSPEEWQAKVRECSSTWNTMADSEKDSFHAMAAEEVGLREEAMRQPFQSAHDLAQGVRCLGNAGFDAASALPKSGLKATSLHRLLLTYQRYKSNEAWSDFDCGLATADGAMSLDGIDLDSSQEDLLSKWSTFAGPALHSGGQPVDSGSLHHTVCGSGPGLCETLPHRDLATKFARSLHHFIKEGASIG